MAPPALRIPIALDLNSLKAQTQEASASVGRAVTNLIQNFNRVNTAANKLGVGITPMKGIELAAKGSSTALQGVSVGLNAVGSAAGRASAVVPPLKAIETAANAGAVAATGLSKTLSGVGVAAGAATGLSWRAAILGTAALTAGTTLLLSAISRTREQLEELVGIFDKAQSRGVSTDFFQSFTRVADDMKISVGDLEKALERAFDATKDKAPVDLSKWEFGKEQITDVEKLLRVFNATGEKLQGLSLFRNAENQDQKVLAVLSAMQELEKQGRKLEALQLGESMFGASFVNNLRTGRTTIDEIFNRVKQAQADGANLISPELIKRAKEVDDQLRIAQNRLQRELTPVWNDLARTMLSIKSSWASVVDLIADAVRLVNQFELGQVRQELALINKALESGDSLIPGVGRVPESIRSTFGAKTTIQEDLERRKAEAEAKVAELEGRSRTRITINSGNNTGARPTPNPDAESARDRFDTAIDNITKRTAATEAETAAIDLGTSARERAKIVAELETLAKQVNTAAGLENTEVTTEQAAKINAVADAYAKAAAGAEAARGPLRSFAREAADANKQLQTATVSALNGLEDAFVSIIDGSASAEEAFRKLADSIIKDLIRIGIKMAITGPLSQALGGAFGGTSGAGGGGGGFNFLFGGGSPSGYADGGYLGAGKIGFVGERGPELIRGPAHITPNHVLRGMAANGSGGNGEIVINNYGADVQAGRRDDGRTEIMVRSMVRDELASGRTNGIMKQKWGISPRGAAVS